MFTCFGAATSKQPPQYKLLWSHVNDTGKLYLIITICLQGVPASLPMFSTWFNHPRLGITSPQTATSIWLSGLIKVIAREGSQSLETFFLSTGSLHWRKKKNFLEFHLACFPQSIEGFCLSVHSVYFMKKFSTAEVFVFLIYNSH